MILKIFKVLKRVIFAVLYIYVYNNLCSPINIFIPINIFTVLLISLLGIPGVMSLILFSIFCI